MPEREAEGGAAWRAGAGMEAEWTARRKRSVAGPPNIINLKSKKHEKYNLFRLIRHFIF